MKKAKLLLVGLAGLLVVLAGVLLRVQLKEPGIGHGPAKDMTVTLAWSGEGIQIPAPVVFPEWGKRTREYRWWKWKKSARDFTTFDLEGCKYVADGQGFGADPQDPEGKVRPIIGGVCRYGPDGTRESYTSYNFRGPSEWYVCDEKGKKRIYARKTGIGIDVQFKDAEEKKCKEWYVNRRGQVYFESVKQNGKWIVTHDLKELKTADEVRWAQGLRAVMEYDPGRPE